MALQSEGSNGGVLVSVECFLATRKEATADEMRGED